MPFPMICLVPEASMLSMKKKWAWRQCKTNKVKNLPLLSWSWLILIQWCFTDLSTHGGYRKGKCRWTHLVTRSLGLLNLLTFTDGNSRMESSENREWLLATFAFQETPESQRGPWLPWVPCRVHSIDTLIWTCRGCWDERLWRQQGDGFQLLSGQKIIVEQKD